jgi:hypothetical protein
MIFFSGHYCSICRDFCGFEGGFLRGGFSGPFSHWVCLDCDDWLDEIERPKKSEGNKNENS